MELLDQEDDGDIEDLSQSQSTNICYHHDDSGVVNSILYRRKWNKTVPSDFID
jgi:hypothetical protein